MPKAGELDWSHLYKTGSIERPEHPLSKPLKMKKGARGSDIAEQFSELEKNTQEAPRQPTNEELFGHLVPTEEQVRKAEYEWENKIQLGYEAALQPVDPSHADRDWGGCKSFKDRLTEEELEKYEEEERSLNKQFQ